MYLALYFLSGAFFAVTWITLTEKGDRWWALCRSGVANRHGGDRLVWLARAVLLSAALLFLWPLFVVWRLAALFYFSTK